ncbi:MAG: lipid-A-disaccharide synthase [candidate division Zixibacteria bacterium RBG_16_48_11]|nr:MAG: lipid-A-disaccharide synthase [candidate division Zixibacteria bacterium RBG_16_48_11]
MKERILIVAGEVSGDLHAAGLISALKKIKPELEFFGIGGSQMQNRGVKVLYHTDKMAFLGFWEVLRHLGFIRQVRRSLLEEIDGRPCRLAILVDYPGFNLRLANDLKKRKIPVIYYISPQVWAWGGKRIEKIRRLVEHMIVFFPFEESLYSQNKVKVNFVGHPLVELAKPTLTREEFYRSLNAPSEQKFIGLFPGSRPQEVEQHLPIMLKVGQILKKRRKELAFLIAVAPGINSEKIRSMLPADLPVRLLSNRNYEIMSYSELLLVKSGTSTVEAALCGTPFAVMYRTSPLSYVIAKRLVKVPHLAMANLLAEKRVVPEFIQNQAHPQNIASEMHNLLEDQQRYQSIKTELGKIRKKLGSGNAYQKAAEVVAEYL